MVWLVAFAWARKGRPEEVIPPLPAPVAAPPWSEALFPPTVITDPGPVPPGLAGISAQSCAACHPRSYEDWRSGPHAHAPTDAHVAASAGLVGCDACHRPLTAQRPTVDTVADGRLASATSAPNPAFDPSAWLEGVGCAACHVRGGVVLTGDAEAATHDAPHPLRYAPSLADGSVCASCHQLTVPGSGTVLYDTAGEHARSGFAEAGVTCLACHGRAGAEPGFADHDVARPLDHALDVGLSMPSLRVVRGGDPVRAVVRVQNTGAGHAVPTGSPWRRLEVRAWLEGPPDARSGVRPRRAEVSVSLGRTLGSDPPFAVSDDTRLMPGQSAELALDVVLPIEVPAKDWWLVVTAGVVGDDDTVERRWPLAVE